MFYLFSIAILLVLLVITVFVFLYVSGLFVGVNVERKQPPFLTNEVTFAYKIHNGPYNEVGYLFTEAYAVNAKCIQCGIRSVARKLPINSEETQVKPEPNLSAVGAILTSDIDEEIVHAFVDAGFRLTHLPPVADSLVGSFPHVSFMSVTIGCRRLFNCIENYAEEHSLELNTVLEFYDGQLIYCVGIIADEDGAKFQSIFGTKLAATETEKAEIQDTILSVQQPVAEEMVETIPKPEETLPAIVTPVEMGDDNEEDSDSLDDSFEKLSPEPLME